MHVCYRAPHGSDRLDDTHDSVGRASSELLKQLLAVADSDFYLCGQTPFMPSAYDELIAVDMLRSTSISNRSAAH